jgi:hypothetical protein
VSVESDRAIAGRHGEERAEFVSTRLRMANETARTISHLLGGDDLIGSRIEGVFSRHRRGEIRS